MLMDLDSLPARISSSTETIDWEDCLAEHASSHPLFRRRRLELSGGKGYVVLTGTVSSYYEKQVAQEFVRHCPGVRQIDNRIEVSYS